MTAHDLDAVCERHGLRIEYDDDAQTWIGQIGVLEGDGCAFVRGAESGADAVCELLKARYDIVTRLFDEDVLCPWLASREADGVMLRHYANSERNAVVALADRLRASDGGAS